MLISNMNDHVCKKGNEHTFQCLVFLLPLVSFISDQQHDLDHHVKVSSGAKFLILAC